MFQVDILSMIKLLTMLNGGWANMKKRFLLPEKLHHNGKTNLQPLQNVRFNPVKQQMFVTFLRIFRT